MEFDLQKWREKLEERYKTYGMISVRQVLNDLDTLVTQLEDIQSKDIKEKLLGRADLAAEIMGKCETSGVQ